MVRMKSTRHPGSVASRRRRWGAWSLAVLCSAGLGCATAVNDSSGTLDAAPRDTGGTGFDATPGDAGSDVSNAADSGTTKDSGADGGVKDSSASDTATSTDSTVADSSSIDSGKTDTLVTDTSVADTFVVDTFVADTFVPPDTSATDTGGDAGPVGKILVWTDATDTLGDDAVTALGGTPIIADLTTFNSLFDAGGYSAVVIDSSLNYLPAGMDTRLAGLATGTGRLAFAYWNLNGDATLTTAFEVSTVSYDSLWRDVYRDTSATLNLFAGKETFPSPLTGAVDGIIDNGDALTLTGTGGILAARLDSATGPGGIAITRGGRVIVNGFAPWDAKTTDADADGIKDMRELWENELVYVLAH